MNRSLNHADLLFYFRSACFSLFSVLTFSHQLSHRATSSIFGCSFLKPPHTSIPCSHPHPFLLYCVLLHTSVCSKQETQYLWHSTSPTLYPYPPPPLVLSWVCSGTLVHYVHWRVVNPAICVLTCVFERSKRRNQPRRMISLKATVNPKRKSRPFFFFLGRYI